MNMLKYFSLGDVIDGFCQGAFGRDDYGKKICVLVRPEYALFEYVDEVDGVGATVLNYCQIHEVGYDIADWKKEAEKRRLKKGG